MIKLRNLDYIDSIEDKHSLSQRLQRTFFFFFFSSLVFLSISFFYIFFFLHWRRRNDAMTIFLLSLPEILCCVLCIPTEIYRHMGVNEIAFTCCRPYQFIIILYSLTLKQSTLHTYFANMPTTELPDNLAKSMRKKKDRRNNPYDACAECNVHTHDPHMMYFWFSTFICLSIFWHVACVRVCVWNVLYRIFSSSTMFYVQWCIVHSVHSVQFAYIYTYIACVSVGHFIRSFNYI